MNIFEALRQSHDVQRKLIERLVETEGDSAERDDLFRQLKRELAAHAAAEERCFYVPLIEHDLTQDAARHGIAEHHEIDELVEKLEQSAYSSPAWLASAKQLKDKVEHHLREEERNIFQLAGKALSETKKASLAKEYLSEFDTQRASR